MIHITSLRFRMVFLATLLLTLLSCNRLHESDQIRVLILSGRNNHEWQKTTPLLKEIYSKTKLFDVHITNSPDTLKYSDLKHYAVIVSNWNTWPDNNIRLTEKWEKDFLRYMDEGGGMVFIHAGASSFYTWDDYHRIGIGRWGKETRHGEQTKGKISGFDKDHPITKGLKDFYIIDEIWEKTDIYPKARPLATVSATDSKDGHSINEYSVFVNETGKGRSFFTTLGHNERAMLNSGFQVLLLRATQWTAGKSVTIAPPSEICNNETSGQGHLNWKESDTTLILRSDSDLIWQFNYNDRFGKPFFHPLCIKNSVITCASPPDHPWHLGFWFSWKFINGVNYWEYLDDFRSEETGYKSAGITKITSNESVKNSDYSADIHLGLSYYPVDGSPVMSEIRKIHISAPLADGSYYIDHENTFTALADTVILDRTPTEGEPDGKSWGGYAGLSVRFSEDYTSPVVTAPDEKNNYKKNSWVYMGFNTLSGDTAGLAVFQDMKLSPVTTSWYVINNPEVPFFYFSPAVLFDGKIILRKGETLHLRYRVWVLNGKRDKESIQGKYDEYIKG